MKFEDLASNKRNKVRVPINKSGTLLFRDVIENCLIVDISTNGIGLIVRSYFQETDEFHIHFPLEEGIEINGLVFVVFVNGSRVGGRLKLLSIPEQQAVDDFINKNTSRMTKDIK
jgi:hypothetical protein